MISGEIAVAGLDDFMRHGPDDALQKFALRKSGRRAVEQDKARAFWRILRRQRHERDGQERQRALLALADNQQVAAALPSGKPLRSGL